VYLLPIPIILVPWEVEVRIVVSGQPRYKKIHKTLSQGMGGGRWKLSVVAYILQSSYSRKYKIGELWSRPSLSKKQDPVSKITRTKWARGA
jgi:hypothetical protein